MKELHKIYVIGAFEKFMVNGLRTMIVLMMAVSANGDQAAFQAYAKLMVMVFLLPMLVARMRQFHENYRFSMILGSALCALSSVGLYICWPSFHDVFMPMLVVGASLIRASSPQMISSGFENKNSGMESAFTKYYALFNLGTVFGVVFCGVVGEVLGWRFGLLSAAVAGFLMLPVCLFLKKPKQKSENNLLTAMFSVSGLVSLSFFVMGNTAFLDIFVMMAIVMAVVWSAMVYRAESDVNRALLKDIYILTAIHVLFFVVVEQEFTSLMLFCQRCSLRDFAGFEIPVTTMKIINPLLTFLVGMFLAKKWRSEKNYDVISNCAKGYLAAFSVCAASFGLTAIAPSFANEGAVNLIFPSLVFVGIVMAELWVEPRGMAMMGKIPARKDFLVAIWYLSIAAGVWLSTKVSEGFSPATLLHTEGGSDFISLYSEMFFKLAVLSVVTLVFAMLCFRKKIFSSIDKKR